MARKTSTTASVSRAHRGPLPPSLTYHLQKPTTMDRGDDGGAEPVPVTPAFCTDAASDSAQETAARWADYGERPGRRRFTVPNEPMEGLTLMALEVRGEGGRAWKVAIEPSPNHPVCVVDLREGPLLEALLSVGCAPGGRINGQWVWGRGGSALGLVRVGSPRHQGMVGQEAATRDPKAATAALVPGHAYRTAWGRQSRPMIYLGEGATTRVTYRYKRGSGGNKYVNAVKHVPRCTVWLTYYSVHNTDNAPLPELLRTGEDSEVVCAVKPPAILADLGDVTGQLSPAERGDLLALARCYGRRRLECYGGEDYALRYAAEGAMVHAIGSPVVPLEGKRWANVWTELGYTPR